MAKGGSCDHALLPAARAAAAIEVDEAAAADAREEATKEDLVNTDSKDNGLGATVAARAPAAARDGAGRGASYHDEGGLH